MPLSRFALKPLLALMLAVPMLGTTAWSQQFVTVHFPGATSTSVNGMDRNNAQVLVGDYTDSENVTHGYIFRGGSFTTLDFPGALQTDPQDVNDLGQVVGDYFDSEQVQHGFLWSNGSFTTVDFPGAASTFAAGINNGGAIVGAYIDSSEVEHGFLLSGGKFSTIDIPGSSGTIVAGINNQNHLAGSFSDEGGTHAFLQTASGTTTLDVPGASITFTDDLDNADELVGYYIANDSETKQGFLFSAGKFTTVNFPGAFATSLTSLSDSGVLTGFASGESVTGGFVRTNGPFAYVPITSTNQTSVFDTATNLLVANIGVGQGPIGAAASPNGEIAYVSNSTGASVSVINTATNEVTATIPVGQRPLGIAFTPDGASAYVANGTSNNVSVINTAENSVVTTVPVGTGPIFVAMTPDGKFAYVTNQFSSSVSVISTASNTVTQTIPLGSSPVGLAITPNGNFVYVTIPATNSVAVISTASNTVVASIPVGAAPVRVSITPDGSTAYVSNQNSGNQISVIDVASNKVFATVTAGATPYGSALTPDGALLWDVNLGSQNISVTSTSNNQTVATLSLSGSASDLAIGSSTPTSQTLKQTLSPTQPNQFNFGPHSFTVTYPPGTMFSNVDMSVTAAETPQADFKQRVAGTQFANAACIVYSGTGGNCVNYQVTCSNASTGGAIPCPGTPTPNIDVKTSYDTLQSITNPDFISAPIGTNQWQSIFFAFYLQRIDPTTKGRTKGFSEFFAIDLGATNSQGAATFQFLAPLRATDPRVFGAGVTVPVKFQLKSRTNPTQVVTDAIAGITVVMVADASGNPQSQLILARSNAFTFQSGSQSYLYSLNTTGFASGIYNLTVYGNAFPAQQVQFTIQTRTATSCGIQSSTEFFTKGQRIKFTARVKPASPSTAVPTGKITFLDSGFSQFVLGTAPLVSGKATLTAVLQPNPSPQYIQAVYQGDNSFVGCQSVFIPEFFTPTGEGTGQN